MLNVFRVEARVADGGHNVPKEKIISRYNKSLNNVKELVELCDILHIYDNTDDLEKADQVQKIFRKIKQKTIVVKKGRPSGDALFIESLFRENEKIE